MCQGSRTGIETRRLALLVFVLLTMTGCFFEVLSLPFLCISQASVCTLPAFTLLKCVLCVSILEKENYGMISVQVPTSLCMQNKLIIHSRYCFVEQYVYPREPNIYMGNLYLRDE